MGRRSLCTLRTRRKREMLLNRVWWKERGRERGGGTSERTSERARERQKEGETKRERECVWVLVRFFIEAIFGHSCCPGVLTNLVC